MKKIILGLLAIGILLAPTVGLATVEEVKETDVLTALDNLVQYAYGIFLTIAALCIVLAGYYFVTAAGNPEKVNTAKNFLLYALIGILVVVVTNGLIALVKKIASGA